MDRCPVDTPISSNLPGPVTVRIAVTLVVPSRLCQSTSTMCRNQASITLHSSVSCRGFWQAIKFLRLIKNLPPHYRIVHHLFVTDAYPYKVHTTHPDDKSGKVGSFNGLFDADSGWCLTEREKRDTYLNELQKSSLHNICRTVTSLFTHFPDEARRRQSKARRQQIIDAELEPEIAVTLRPEFLRRSRLPQLMADVVFQILEIVAPSILSFTSSGEHPCYMPNRSVHINFPMLTELTLSIDWPWSATCPSLCRLNLLEPTGMGSFPLRSLPPVSAPMITHVCLNASWWGAGERVMEGLRRLGLGQSQSDRDEKGPIAQHLPGSVQRAILRLEPMAGPSYGDNTEEQHIQCILSLADHDERIICLFRQQPAYLGLERWWIERMNDGEGCWSTKGKIEPRASPTLSTIP